MKDFYTIQPYHVGSKYNKSLALVIPAQIVKKYRITPSTVFLLTTKKDDEILLRTCAQISVTRVEEENSSASSHSNKSATPICCQQRGVTNR